MSRWHLHRILERERREGTPGLAALLLRQERATGRGKLFPKRVGCDFFARIRWRWSCPLPPALQLISQKFIHSWGHCGHGDGRAPVQKYFRVIFFSTAFYEVVVERTYYVHSRVKMKRKAKTVTVQKPAQLAVMPFPTLGSKADSFWSAVSQVFTLFVVLSLLFPVANALKMIENEFVCV